MEDSHILVNDAILASSTNSPTGYRCKLSATTGIDQYIDVE